ncbi:hypothetical protein BHE74_00048134 [Ensete ventricosum]|nr:hypothetical protein BHE74_00048134 [Ensete ventricosum]
MCRGAIALRSRSTDNGINLFLDGSLWVWRRILGRSAFWRCSLVSDILTEMAMMVEVLDMVFEVLTFLRITFVLPIETIVPSFVTTFRCSALELHEWNPRDDSPTMRQWRSGFPTSPRLWGAAVPPNWADHPELVAIGVVFVGVLVEESAVGMPLAVGVEEYVGQRLASSRPRLRLG